MALGNGLAYTTCVISPASGGVFHAFYIPRTILVPGSFVTAPWTRIGVGGVKWEGYKKGCDSQKTTSGYKQMLAARGGVGRGIRLKLQASFIRIATAVHAAAPGLQLSAHTAPLYKYVLLLENGWPLVHVGAPSLLICCLSFFTRYEIQRHNYCLFTDILILIWLLLFNLCNFCNLENCL